MATVFKKMYKVTYEQTISATGYFEAESAAEAIKMAGQELDPKEVVRFDVECIEDD